MNLHSENSRRGLTKIEVLVVIVVIAVLLAMLLPALAKAKRKSSRIGCVGCLKQISLSSKSWALDNGDKYPMELSVTNGGTLELIGGGNAFVHFQAMSNELTTTKLLVCPNDKTRTYASSFADLRNENVSYFVGVDVNGMYPSSILSGDGNILVNGEPAHGLLSPSTNTTISWTTDRHGQSHNVLLADGSVAQTVAESVGKQMHQTNSVIGRWAIP